MVDAEGYELLTYRVVYYFETGHIDGGGMGRWMDTVDSFPFPERDGAEALRDQWHEDGKLEKMRWGEFRPKFMYGTSRIRRAEEIAKSDQEQSNGS
jgi:hypothetical protein